MRVCGELIEVQSPLKRDLGMVECQREECTKALRVSQSAELLIPFVPPFRLHSEFPSMPSAECRWAIQ